MKKSIALLLALFSIATFAQQKGSFTDPRDGKNYKTVKIGVQTWMTEDLKYAPGGKCYNDDIDYCKKYGRLYPWEAAKKVCPSGWHLPSDAEWTKLTDFVGGSSTAGTKLKAKSGWNNNGNGMDDEYGFSALPGGFGLSDDGFLNVGISGFWWSATESSASYAWGRLIDYNYAKVGRYDGGKPYFYPVRCVQD
jgi:uncharacterized protein (TIGR02145 family)